MGGRWPQPPAIQGPSSDQGRQTYPTQPGCAIGGSSRDNLSGVYFTDRGIEELAARRGEDQVSFEWLADQLRTFVDQHPEFETPIERLATWLARLDDDED